MRPLLVLLIKISSDYIKKGFGPFFVLKKNLKNIKKNGKLKKNEKKEPENETTDYADRSVVIL